MFARGRSKNAPTDEQNLVHRKQIDTPTDFKSVGVLILRMLKFYVQIIKRIHLFS